MSNAPPARSASFETVATTSPVESSALTASPERAAWWPTTCTSLKDAWSQFWTDEAVAEDTGNGLDDAEHGEERAETGERIAVVVHDPLLDRLADRVRHQRLRDHPDDPERDRDQDGSDLMSAHPDEQPDRRAGVRLPRIGEWELDQGCATAAAPPPRVPEKRPTRFGVTGGRAACTRCGAARAPRGRASRSPRRRTRPTSPRTTSPASRPRTRGCASRSGRGTSDRG